MKERTLRVYTSFRKSEFPMLVLQGKWLLRAGFEPGDYIKLQIRHDEILIKNMRIDMVHDQDE